MLVVWALLNPSSWVIYSPMVKQSAEKGYEDGRGTFWEGSSSFSLDSYVLRWGLPQTTYGNDAMSGGITFALHSSFCDRMLPLFPESAEHLEYSKVLAGTFLTCTDLRDTVKRAMDTWAINHRRIYFRDVTDQCMHIKTFDMCPAAELFIVPDSEGSNPIVKVGDAVAYVIHNLSSASLDYAPYSTAGELISPGLGIRRAQMTFRAPATQEEFCYYLDTTFCYGFHRMDDAVGTIRIAFICLYIFSIMIIVCIAGCGVSVVCCPREPPDESEPVFCHSHKMTRLVGFLANLPTITLCLSLFLIIFCPIFYYRIFLPCWDCYDFEATMAHEIGHVLGFHHPDAEWELNLNADVSAMTNETCQKPLDHVHMNRTRDVADSIMYSMTKHRDRTCLSTDDLEGLNYLYPTCDGAMTPLVSTGEPGCIKSKRFGGWLRLIYAVLVPWTLVSVIAILSQYIVRCQHHRRLKVYEHQQKKLKNLIERDPEMKALVERKLSMKARSSKNVSLENTVPLEKTTAKAHSQAHHKDKEHCKDKDKQHHNTKIDHSSHTIKHTGSNHSHAEKPKSPKSLSDKPASGRLATRPSQEKLKVKPVDLKLDKYDGHAVTDPVFKAEAGMSSYAQARLDAINRQKSMSKKLPDGSPPSNWT